MPMPAGITHQRYRERLVRGTPPKINYTESITWAYTEACRLYEFPVAQGPPTLGQVMPVLRRLVYLMAKHSAVRKACLARGKRDEE